MKITTLDEHRLSDGGLAVVTRQGNTYGFMRSYNSLTEAPDCTFNLRKAVALGMLADAIKNDVLEVDL